MPHHRCASSFAEATRGDPRVHNLSPSDSIRNRERSQGSSRRELFHLRSETRHASHDITRSWPNRRNVQTPEVTRRRTVTEYEGAGKIAEGARVRASCSRASDHLHHSTKYPLLLPDNIALIRNYTAWLGLLGL